MKSCIVSFVDSEGLRHSVQVEAGSLFEAAALAVATFRRHHCTPGLGSRLDVEVRSTTTHTVTVRKLQEWLSGGAKSPNEAVMKERLKNLLAGVYTVRGHLINCFNNQ